MDFTVNENLVSMCFSLQWHGFPGPPAPRKKTKSKNRTLKVPALWHCVKVKQRYLYGMLYIFQSNPLFYRGLILAEFEYQLQVVWKCCQKYIIYLVLTLICFPENGPAPALLTQI